MIDRKILKQMCFVKARGQNHEVWYHNTECRVHYGTALEFSRYNAYASNHVDFNGDTDSMEHFFAEFIENVEAGEANRHMEITEDW